MSIDPAEPAMTSRADLHDGLAALLRYPGPEHRAVGESYLALARQLAPEVADAVAKYLEETAGLAIEGLEELYTVTFDLSPVVTLEIGWHLFGEQYERGAFLARLREELATAGVAEQGELPDHLTLVLPLLGRLPAGARRESLAAPLRQALVKMHAAVDETPNPFRHLLTAADRLVGPTPTAEADSAPPAPRSGETP